MTDNDFGEFIGIVDEPDLGVVVDNGEEYVIAESLTLGDCDTETAGVIGVCRWGREGVWYWDSYIMLDDLN